MYDFTNNGRSQKCQKFAVAIGKDSARSILTKFAGDYNRVFFANDAKDISK